MQQRDGGEMGGAVQGGIVYASADFPDVDTIDIKQSVNITTSVSNVILHHVSEAADKQNQHRTWKRKVREILQNHQERILQFFVKPLTDDHPLKVSHLLLTKYGKIINYDSSKPIPQFFRDYITESPQKGLEILNTYILQLSESRPSDTPVQKWLNMSRHMLDYLRDTGDELIRLDTRLQLECQRVDSVVERVSQLVSLPNPDLDGFQEMMDKYINKQFEITNIEMHYWDYIYTLQKYSILRDILIPQRIANQSEPICCICMTEPIIMAMSPCGHTFCSNCSKRTIVCHVCRQPVTNRLRVFFG
jgi:hypothetical protein